MTASLLQIVLLGLVQGATELLPVSSSAHVIVAEKLMRLDPTSPEMTFLLVMLHTGTLFAVIAYFRKAWRRQYLATPEQFRGAVANIGMATAYTLGIGFGLKVLIEKFFAFGGDSTEVESLFGNLTLMAGSLAAVGLLIIYAGRRDDPGERGDREGGVTLSSACWIGVVQALTLPFRGFSRSGATISTGILLGTGKRRAEEFSFALSVVLTPAVVGYELLRLLESRSAMAEPVRLVPLLAPSLLGALASFCSGLLALRLLSRWLAAGRWSFFGAYCLAAAAVVFALARAGY
jgi:undecaprenyl-diphosphatase